MAEITESAVRKVLETVIDPATAKSVVAQGMVGGIAVRGGHVAVTLDVDPARGTALEPLRQACEQAVRAIPGVLSATAVMTSERPAGAPWPWLWACGAGGAGRAVAEGAGRSDVITAVADSTPGMARTACSQA